MLLLKGNSSLNFQGMRVYVFDDEDDHFENKVCIIDKSSTLSKRNKNICFVSYRSIGKRSVQLLLCPSVSPSVSQSVHQQ